MWVDLEEDIDELFGDIRVDVQWIPKRRNHIVKSRGDRSGQAKRYRAKMTEEQIVAERARHRAYRLRKKAEKSSFVRT